ncbi:hypothetical protein B7463_g8261, partial [Scytalidium lignicola]
MSFGSPVSITCGKGHNHPPWNRSGVLHIAKCETVCGFCWKETRTAANLRKHAAIHIKNEGLDLTISESSSGRRSLDMSHQEDSRKRSASIPEEELRAHEDMDLASSPQYSNAQLQPAFEHAAYPSWQIATTNDSSQYQSDLLQYSPSALTTAYSSPMDLVSFSQEHASHDLIPYSSSITLSDPYRHLRDANIPTKAAWVAIPASEGFRILDFCKSMSQTSSSPPSTSGTGSSSASELQVPCYNRETLFDDEWQEHMKDVHGVYLVWPDTWMRRIEVLDLDRFGGDIALLLVIMAPIVATPTVPINFVTATNGEMISLGPIKMRVMEDGSRTDNRLSTVELIVPPHTDGPPAHWHEMHDETFLITKGVIRFHVPKALGLEAQEIDAKEGDYVVVPIRAPHTFSNPSDGESRFVNTFTPAFYVHYFKLLSELIGNGEKMTPEINEHAMAYYATIPVQTKQ